MSGPVLSNLYRLAHSILTTLEGSAIKNPSIEVRRLRRLKSGRVTDTHTKGYVTPDRLLFAAQAP